MKPVSLLVLLLTLPSAAPAQSPTHSPGPSNLTAAEAIHRIQTLYTPSAPPNTVDTIKAGDPTTPVTGIATTFMDTMDVLREAARRGDNLVITHEPTFYNHRDDTTFFKDDPVYKEKLAFIEAHHMVVFRLHDEIHKATPDHIETGLIDALGWQPYIARGNAHEAPFLVTLPPITVANLAAELAKKLDDPTLRVVGDPHLTVSHIVINPGSAGMERQVQSLRLPGTELLIVGEGTEWETIPYVRDAQSQGRPMALILLGHQASEESGMEQCAKDLRTLFPNLHVDHILAHEAYWTPAHPPR